MRADGDPVRWNTPDGIDRIEHGEVVDRPDEERQRFPGDREAVEGMGPITAHKEEHLMPSDKGITLMRRRLRRHCRDLMKGKRPPQPTDPTESSIATYGSDTVLRLPRIQGRDDRAYMRQIESKVMKLKFEAECLDGEDRDSAIIKGLQELELTAIV